MSIYDINNMGELIKDNSYVGRGIVIGKSADGEKAAVSFFYGTNEELEALDGDYTVFGEVVKGLEVVDAIQNVKCDKNDRPLRDVRIIKMELIK